MAKTGIICTMGPATRSASVIKNLSDKQLSELENAMIRKIEECLKGGKKYGIEYISSET